YALLPRACERLALRDDTERDRARTAARRLRSAGGEAPLRGRRLERALPPRPQGVPARRREPGAQRVQRRAARRDTRPERPAHAAPRVPAVAGVTAADLALTSARRVGVARRVSASCFDPRNHAVLRHERHPAPTRWTASL